MSSEVETSRGNYLRVMPRDGKPSLAPKRFRSCVAASTSLEMTAAASILAICIATLGLTLAAREPTMKAIVIHEYGGPEVLKYEDTPRPEPKDDQLLIRVIAAGVNPVDGMIRSGMFAKEGNRAFPIILGGDVAGVVEKVGSKITKFKAGDPVFAYVSLDNSGGYAQYALVTEREAAPMPKSLTYVEAAAVPIVAMTAWQALIDTAKLQSGQTVLVHGGSGGVGSFAIQIAKARGAKVIATASTANQDFLKQLGADVAIDYTKQNFEDVAKDVDVVLDSIGRDTLARSYGVVKKGGIIVSLVARPKESELEKHGIRGAALNVEPNSEELAEIGKLIDDKKIKVIVSQTFPLSEAMKAQEQVATGHTRGKIVLKVADEPK
jgi:NADPH:quinone reductase-like Zn-dependent oxidoreductase